MLLAQGLDTNTPKRERDDMMRVYKETLARRQKDAEFRMEKHQKDLLDFSLRRFKRRSILSFHNLEQRLLKEVGVDAEVALSIGWSI